MVHHTGPEEGLKKAAMSTRKCANVYLTLYNRFIKGLILESITQELKQSGLTLIRQFTTPFGSVALPTDRSSVLNILALEINGSTILLY